MKGIVFDEGGLAVVDDLEVRDLRADEVRVEIQAAGVCHSDVSRDRRHHPVPDAGGARPRGRRHRHRGRLRRSPGWTSATTS